MEQSIQLAKLWMTLDSIKDELDNVAIPLGSHLSLDDPELMIVMEELSAKINSHFERFELLAHARHIK
jgi:hypothetical protein